MLFFRKVLIKNFCFGQHFKQSVQTTKTPTSFLFCLFSFQKARKKSKESKTYNSRGLLHERTFLTVSTKFFTVLAIHFFVCWLCSSIFRRGKKFRKEKLHFSRRSSLPSHDLASDVQNCLLKFWCLMKNISVRCHRGWETTVGWFDSSCRPLFHYIFRYSSKPSTISTGNNKIPVLTKFKVTW